jgi:hypothetical protein
MYARHERETAALSPGRPALGRVAGCLGAGLALGVLTNLAQGWLPGSWNQLANSGAFWSVAAFVAGALLAAKGVRTALAGGLCAELALVVGYYGYAQFGYQRGGIGMLTPVLEWLLVAVVAGPLFGAAGAWWRRGDRGRRIVGGSALAGVVGAEAASDIFALHYMSQGWVTAATAVALPLVMARGNRERALTLALALPLGLLAYLLVFQGFLGSALG